MLQRVFFPPFISYFKRLSLHQALNLCFASSKLSMFSLYIQTKVSYCVKFSAPNVPLWRCATHDSLEFICYSNIMCECPWDWQSCCFFHLEKSCTERPWYGCPLWHHKGELTIVLPSGAVLFLFPSKYWILSVLSRKLKKKKFFRDFSLIANQDNKERSESAYKTGPSSAVDLFALPAPVWPTWRLRRFNAPLTFSLPRCCF